MMPYASVYCEVDRVAIRFLPLPAYAILHYLCDRANHLGICWPEIRTIAEETGICKDTVQKSLDCLYRTGCIAYIRKNARDPITGRIMGNVYQVSPYLYVIRAKYQAQAEASWWEHGGRPLSFSGQDRSNRTNVSEANTDTLYQNQQQQDPSENTGSLSFTPPLLPDEEEKESGEYKREQPGTPDPERRPHSEARQQRSKVQKFRHGNRGTNKSDVGLERTIYPEIERIAEELPNQVEEWLADRARRETGMSIRFARGLIKHFTGTKVEAALYDHSLRGTSIKNKAGYVFYLLANNFVETPNEAYEAGRPDDPDGRRYVSGKYADSIEH